MSSEPIRPLSVGDHHRTLFHGNRERTYLVHVPADYDGASAWPVVLAFHGGATDAAAMARFSNLDEQADRSRCIAVYPNGTGRREHLLTWNAGNCCGYAMWNEVDDVGFVGAIIDQLAREANVDLRRVYAVGMSNGGMLAYRLASELSARIAAIGSIAGPMATATCAPARPVPLIHFHGTHDEFAPFAGGIGARSIVRSYKYSVAYTMEQWIGANRCAREPEVERLPSTATPDLPVVRHRYRAGRDGAEIDLYIIENGGHTWPGNPPRVQFLGPCTQNISANALLLEFFLRHQLPE
ncbi:MAG TPA: PHB depolymerase family esterase [Pirellulales bacterium]|jgi:polyhydroxybutyrate depolymerase|nr:PHB depolymerase family esterase [Pirellulales bacterium]